MSTADCLMPLSYQQEEMIRLLHEFPESAPSNDCVFLFSLPSGVNVTLLAAAIDDLVLRHPALRTSIDGDKQRIHPLPTAPVTCQRTRAAADDLAAMLLSGRYTVSEVSAGDPLFRAAIYQTPDGTILGLTIHHLVHDGWSEPVLWNDLSELYAARAEGRAAKLDPVAFSCGDFATAQRSAWAAIRDRAVAYWSAELDGLPDSVRWPRPAAPEGDETRTETIAVGAEIVSRLVRSAHVPPFLTLLSATAAAIARETGTGDFLIGSNAANRESAKSWGVVGHFANTRMTRMRFPADLRFRGLLDTVKSKWLAAEQYRDVYIDPLLRELGCPQLIKVDMLNIPGHFAAAPWLDGPAKPVRVRLNSKYRRDIMFTWIPGGNDYTLHIQYQSARIDQATVQRLGMRVRSVLAGEGATA